MSKYNSIDRKIIIGVILQEMIEDQKKIDVFNSRMKSRPKNK